MDLIGFMAVNQEWRIYVRMIMYDLADLPFHLLHFDDVDFGVC